MDKISWKTAQIRRSRVERRVLLPVLLYCFWRNTSRVQIRFWKYFARFTSKRKRNTLKGFVIRSSRKKEFAQQREMPKKAISGKRADRSFLCSSKTQEWNSFVALFPICRKYSRTDMSDSPHGPHPANMPAESFIFHGVSILEGDPVLAQIGSF